jgi:hypothetical protein
MPSRRGHRRGGKHREIQRESLVVPRDPDQARGDLEVAWDLPGLVLAPGGLTDSSELRSLPLRQPTMLPPATEAARNLAHDNSDSNQKRRGQQGSFAKAIKPATTLRNVSSRTEDRLAKAMAESLKRAFVVRAEQLYPGLPRGWQSRLEEDTARDPSVALKQPMISQIMNEETKAYRLTTLVRMRNFIGKRLADIFGLPPIEAAREEHKRLVREVLLELADETPMPPTTSRVHERRLKK